MYDSLGQTSQSESTEQRPDSIGQLQDFGPGGERPEGGQLSIAQDRGEAVRRRRDLRNVERKRFRRRRSSFQGVLARSGNHASSNMISLTFLDFKMFKDYVKIK